MSGFESVAIDIEYGHLVPQSCWEETVAKGTTYDVEQNKFKYYILDNNILTSDVKHIKIGEEYPNITTQDVFQNEVEDEVIINLKMKPIRKYKRKIKIAKRTLAAPKITISGLI